MFSANTAHTRVASAPRFRRRRFSSQLLLVLQLVKEEFQLLLVRSQWVQYFTVEYVVVLCCVVLRVARFHRRIIMCCNLV